MPRLLLVDDNQRIHQIVETLLAATDIELTCAASGAEALELASAGDYDVALVDTTMQGMDGWELLERLRSAPATARMPIAMMAGVLDVVDPEMAERAPIQGFLKKPVELRDLADRVRALMATPVPAPAGDTLATVPGLKLAGHPLPEDADVLLLEPGDVLEEAPFEPAAEPSGEVMPSLELEELDLESLKGLALEPPAAPAAEAVPEPAPAEATVPAEAFMEFTAEDALPERTPARELPDLGPALDVPEPALEAAPGPFGEPTPVHPLPTDWSDESESLLDLGGETPWTPPAPPAPEVPADPMAAHSDFDNDSFLEQDAAPEPTPAFLPDLPEEETTPRTLPPTGDFEATFPEVELQAAPFAQAEEIPVPVAPFVSQAEEFPAPVAPFVSLAEELSAPAAPIVPLAEEAPAPPAPEPASVPAPALSGDPLAALLDDPVLMDRLAKAVVARLGEQALRELAWEVMPELAERLGRR